MKIGVIGAGWLGGTVGRNWVRAGHEVLFSTRHPEKLAAGIKPLGARASTGTPREAAAFGPVVLIATPYQHLAAIGRDFAAELRGKIVLDASNPGPIGGAEYLPESEKIGVGPLSARLLPGTRLVRCFSCVDATDIAASIDRKSGKLGAPIAGDDAEAVRIATQLTVDAGCDPLVVGDLEAARIFQRGGPGFRANTTLPRLRLALGLNDNA
jgi:8-hydroxy-5-deazaflavin:NADPH oxidoreductase